VVIDTCCGTGTSGIAALGLGCAGWLGLDKDQSLSDHVVERISTFLQGEAKKEASSKLFYKEQAGKITWKIFAKAAPTFVIPPTAPEEGMVSQDLHCFPFVAVTDLIFQQETSLFGFQTKRLPMSKGRICSLCRVKRVLQVRT
jgi:hypothetical protein